MPRLSARSVKWLNTDNKEDKERLITVLLECGIRRKKVSCLSRISKQTHDDHEYHDNIQIQLECSEDVFLFAQLVFPPTDQHLSIVRKVLKKQTLLS